MPPGQAVETVMDHFRQHFRYELGPRFRRYQGRSRLEDFLIHRRSGHCEYFATATALLLRLAGIPTRYAVGYSVQEYSKLERRYVARSRHAHSWVLAHIDERWETVDPTPPIWGAFESEQASRLQPLLDLISFLSYRLGTQPNPDTDTTARDRLLLWLILPLVALLAWRLAHEPRVRRNGKTRGMDRTGERNGPGADSEFYRIVERIDHGLQRRRTGETLYAWMQRLTEQQNGFCTLSEPSRPAHRFFERRPPPHILRLPSVAPGSALEVLAGYDALLPARQGETPDTFSGDPFPDLPLLLALHYRYRFDPAGLTAPRRTWLRKLTRRALEHSPKSAHLG